MLVGALFLGKRIENGGVGVASALFCPAGTIFFYCIIAGWLENDFGSVFHVFFLFL